MKHFIACAILMSLISNMTFSQDLSENITSRELADTPASRDKNHFVFNVYEDPHELEEVLNAIDISSIRNHYMGNKVAKRFHLFEDYYAYYSEPAPGAFSGRKIIQKPVIYSSIYKIEKYLKKQMRQGKINKDYGSDEMTRYLDFALLLVHADTTELEEELKSTESPEALMKVFNRITINSR